MRGNGWRHTWAESMETVRIIDKHRLYDRFATGQAMQGPLMRALLENASGGPLLQPGARIGPWRILELLGSGGMSHVYLAERCDGAFEQQVALKLVRRNADLIHRLRHERQLIAHLRHPHIVSLIDSDETAEGDLWLAMGLVEGMPIDQYAHQNRLDWRARVRLVDAVCAAVEYAHGRGLIHRDIKPANVLVDAQGHPRLLDFGIAFEQGAASAPDHALTPGFAAPEQLAGQPLTTATDVFQLGLLLQRVWAAGAAPVSAPRAVQADLDALVRRATAEDPTQRHVTAAALRADLDALLARRPLAHLGARTRVRMARFIERHRLPLAVAAAASLMLVVSLTLAALQLRDERDRALANEARAEGIARFLVDTLSTANPWGAEAGGGTLVQAMERAAGRLDSELADAPDVRRELRSTIATVYTMAEAGKPCLEVLSSPAAQADLASAAPVARASLLIMRSECQLILEQREAAWADLDAAEQSLGSEDSVAARQLRAWVLVDRGQLRKMDERLDESNALLQQALELARAAGSREQEYRATRMLGFNQLTSNQAAEAAAQLQRALDLAGEIYGPTHRSTLTSAGGLAMAMDRVGRGAEAEALLQRSLAAATEVQLRGPEAEIVVAELRDNLATLHFQQGRLDECIKTARPVFDTYRRLAPDTTRSFNPAWRLASCAYQAGQLDLASEYAGHALHYARIGAPMGVINAERMLAAVAARRGQVEQAATHLQRAEEAYAATSVSNANIYTALLLAHALHAVARKDQATAQEKLDAAAERIGSATPPPWLAQERDEVSALVAALGTTAALPAAPAPAR
ncbi:MAG: serine/threonine protein kinase [Rhodanobacteraceae bacterium]|nr:serine/threonine protein kinase [Rhodanobacteraceae bacterium]